MKADSVELERRAWEDHARVLGKVVFPQIVCGFIEPKDDSGDFLLSSLHPFVVQAADKQSIARWIADSWLDPVWDLVPLYPEELEEDLGVCLRSIWMFAHSYNLDGTIHPAELRYRDSFKPRQPLMSYGT